jgi:hypothetical protein
MKAKVRSVLDRVLTPLENSLTPEVAKVLVNLRADKVLQRRVDRLADKNTAGRLTAKEHEEYTAIVQASNVIAMMQAKARAMLTAQQK